MPNNIEMGNLHIEKKKFQREANKNVISETTFVICITPEPGRTEVEKSFISFCLDSSSNDIINVSSFIIEIMTILMR